MWLYAPHDSSYDMIVTLWYNTILNRNSFIAELLIDIGFYNDLHPLRIITLNNQEIA